MWRRSYQCMFETLKKFPKVLKVHFPSNTEVPKSSQSSHFQIFFDAAWQFADSIFPQKRRLEVRRWSYQCMIETFSQGSIHPDETLDKWLKSWFFVDFEKVPKTSNFAVLQRHFPFTRVLKCQKFPGASPLDPANAFAAPEALGEPPRPPTSCRS